VQSHGSRPARDLGCVWRGVVTREEKLDGRRVGCLV
jgi:hypothetical protein